MVIVDDSEEHDREELRVSTTKVDGEDLVWEGVKARKPEDVVTVDWASDPRLVGIEMIRSDGGKDFGLRGKGSRFG